MFLKNHIRFSPAFILSTVFIMIVTVTAFWDINKIFFQQDEWLGLGGAIYREETYGTFGNIAQVFNFKNINEGVRFLPITSVSNFLIFHSFGLNFSSYGLLALLVAALCALLLNLIVYKLTNSYLLSTFTSVLWVTNNLAYQAFTWISTIVPSLFTTLFFLLGLYFLMEYNEKRKLYFVVASILSVSLSLLAKETSIFYLVVYLVVIWFFSSKKSGLLDKIKLSFLFFIPFIISILLPRLLFLLGGQRDFSPPINGATRGDIIYNFFLLPAKSLFHIFLPSAEIYEIVYSINRIFFGNQVDGFVISRIVGDAFSLLVAFYILLFVLIVVVFASKENKKLILFGLLSFFASILPFILFKNTDVTLEPRYYILPAIFSSLTMVIVIYSYFSKIKFFGRTLMILVISAILLVNINGVKKMLNADIKTGNYRKEILRTVSVVEPRLGRDNVFYFFTGHTGFYEFQSGFGQTLATYFYHTGKIPREVLIDRDFWGLSYEGLKRFDKGRFGYYMSYDKLLKGLRENKDISLSSVHSFYWDYQNHSVKDVSGEIWEKLAKDLKDAKAF